jgi:hypothetical protein
MLIIKNTINCSGQQDIEHCEKSDFSNKSDFFDDALRNPIFPTNRISLMFNIILTVSSETCYTATPHTRSSNLTGFKNLSGIKKIHYSSSKTILPSATVETMVEERLFKSNLTPASV